jgi:hypothetical protein
MNALVDIVFEVFAEIIFNKIIKPIFKTTGVFFLWLINFGRLNFDNLWKKPNTTLYGFLIWITLIITTMLYFIFKK